MNHPTDVLVLPFWEGALEACPIDALKESLKKVLASHDFKGKNGETFLIHLERRVFLLGLGPKEKVTAETLRRAYAQAVKAIQQIKATKVEFLFPKTEEDVSHGVFEGVLLSNYAYHSLLGHSLKEAAPLLEEIQWTGLHAKESFARFKVIADGVYFVRDLVNGNADDVTPAFLAEKAKDLEKQSPQIKTTIRDKKWLEQEKMGLILAVNRASSVDPFLIEVAYRGNPSSQENIVLVGKGVSYDTGGLSLKPTDGMLGMKCDMAGAAAVLGTIKTIAALGMKVNVTALVPTVENCIDALSYKVGDVYTSYSGKTVEVNNTDAEGRLILADALSYAVKNLQPTFIIDLATLTGNVVMALGERMAGFCSNDDAMADSLIQAGSKTADLLWRLPLIPEYKEAFKSDIADMVNSGGRDAGAIKGALFLQEFVGDTKWAHIDIAGTAYLSKPKYYHPTKATGYGVCLLTEFLRRHIEK